MAACATYLSRRLTQIGLRAWVEKTAGAPIVRARWEGARGRPRLLIYGHYDVQPAEPASCWTSPPFEPALRDGRLYGRGASDDKGQLFAHVLALESYLQSQGRLPLSVECVFEGEEEIGSPSLRAWALAEPGSLAADMAVISDSPMAGPDRPALTVGLRGQLALELELRGPDRDLHSGLFGGAVPNPIQALAGLLAGLQTQTGRVAVDGFYADVRRLTESQRRDLRRSGPSDRQLLAWAGATAAAGEEGYSAYERVATRPALTVNGVSGGYEGAGSKSVIPSTATAKLSFRLVPDQDPLVIERLVHAHCERALGRGISWRLSRQKAEWPVLTTTQDGAFQAAFEAMHRGFGIPPVVLRCGGSVSVAALFQRELRIPTVLMGFGLPTDRQHAPDEHMRIRTLQQAVATCIHFLALAGDAEGL